VILGAAGIVIAVVLFRSFIGQPSRGNAPSGPPPPSGTVLFSDTLDNAASGWYQVQLKDGSLAYRGGAYQIAITTPDGGIAAPHPKLQNLGDVRVEVEAANLDPAAGGSFGITCRDRNDDNYYGLLISSDGRAWIMKSKWGLPLVLASTTGAQGAIKPGRAVNRLRADCIGDMLTLWVNDQLVLRAQDNDFGAGRIRLSAGAGGQAGVLIAFARMIVTQP
jgi:hypothetical protein